jgi:hypothetical protein
MAGGRAFDSELRLRAPNPSWFSRGRRVCFFRRESQNPDPSKSLKSQAPGKPKSDTPRSRIAAEGLANLHRPTSGGKSGNYVKSVAV